MGVWFETVLKIIKLGVPLYGAAAVTGLLFLILPPGVIEWLGATDFLKEFKWAFGLAFVFFSVFVLIFLVKWLATSRGVRTAFDPLVDRATVQLFRRKFDNLTVREKYLIMEIVESHETTFWYPPNGRTIQSLVDKGWVKTGRASRRRVRVFEIRGNIWLSLNKIRQHVRSEWERFSEEDKIEIKDVQKTLKTASENSR